MSSTHDSPALLFLVTALFFVFGNISAYYFPMAKLVGLDSEEVIEVEVGNTQVKIKNVPDVPAIDAVSNQKTVKQNASSVKLNQAYTVGSVQYVVFGASNKGSELGFKKTEGKYILVNIKATNIGQTEASLSKILLQDSKGRQYQIDSWALYIQGVEGNMYGRTNNLDKLVPGIAETFYAPFEVASDAQGFKLIHPSTSGGAVAQVDLGF